MTPGARLSAAMDVLAEIETQRRPAADALRDWGTAHRFAGSGDRAAIASLAYDALRVRLSAAWVMGAATPRAVVLAALRLERGLATEAVAGLLTGQAHAPASLDADEAARLEALDLSAAPDFVRGDYPEWLAPAFAAAFGEDAVAEGRALAQRAPLDLRVNTLKSNWDKATRALSHLSPQPTPLAPDGMRVAARPDGRAPALAAEPAYLKGQVEIQDEGSQLAARLAGAAAGRQVLDLCAGGGGKSLALAALMGNKGQVYATDQDARRLAPIHARIARADARNIQVRTPRGRASAVEDLVGRCDLVLVDAPCTGTGAWRRNPDAKWRVRPGALAERIKDQDEALRDAVRFVKPGGRLVYVTCSVLRDENEERIAALLVERPDLAPVPANVLIGEAGLPDLASRASPHGPGLRLSPHTTGTDGFYIAGMTLAG